MTTVAQKSCDLSESFHDGGVLPIKLVARLSIRREKTGDFQVLGGGCNELGVRNCFIITGIKKRLLGPRLLTQHTLICFSHGGLG